MTSPLIRLISNSSEKNFEPLFVSALALQGITVGHELWEPKECGGAGGPVWIGTGPTRRIKRGAVVWFANNNEEVRESVAEVEALFSAKLKELATR